MSTSVVYPIFPKPSSTRLVKLKLIDMECESNRNVGRSELSGELSVVSAPRETVPTPVVTHTGAGPASTMVTRSRAREGKAVVCLSIRK